MKPRVPPHPTGEAGEPATPTARAPDGTCCLCLPLPASACLCDMPSQMRCRMRVACPAALVRHRQKRVYVRILYGCSDNVNQPRTTSGGFSTARRDLAGNPRRSHNHIMHTHTLPPRRGPSESRRLSSHGSTRPQDNFPGQLILRLFTGREKSPPGLFPGRKTSGFHGSFACVSGKACGFPGSFARAIASLRSRRLFVHSLLTGRGKSPPGLFPRRKTSGFHGSYAPAIASLR